MTKSDIIDALPYDEPFLFVDEIQEINADGVVGTYLFKEDATFYKGHFKDLPVTPGVLLTECCAQIGVVCLGMQLLGETANFTSKGMQIGMSSTHMEFLLPVKPNEKVTVSSEKVYFRFNKLKCKVKMHNSAGGLVCKGEISGMFKTNANA
ncbi:3-hydroxyacyl-ACP dehydratase FabZ family protein [Zobellia uliginosa]|uniref:3-hydroxyacyl-ACP dehydratase FabZ family protein n=1 Tax=Zobellia uliginosa TaxID=143224 RepID=UPI001C07588F|nr:hydroxymyristoyl-ACP dehydratase [Zobellia uliginosa]MBU2946616.1 hydroxymyristoyl-ACP dehydratase [Zobellia uliginosa]